MRKGALGGLLVLDLTRVLAGPYCTMLMADMGAEIIKIETPGTGDDSRGFGPYINGESSYYMNLNRNKKGITLNLKHEKGKEIFIELVKKADIIVENFRPGTMEKLGFGYEDLKKINEKIIYGCVSGFGHYGPYSKRGGYDIIGQAVGGLMSTSGWPDGEPTRTGTAMGDVLGGLSVAVGILAAYINRRETGKGQKVDVALVDSVVSSLEIITQIYLAEGRVPERIGNRYESVYPYDSFRTRNGSLVIACGNNKLFTILSKLMGKPELTADARFCDNVLRVKNHAALKLIVEEWSIQFDMDELVELLLQNEIPAGPINTIDRVVSDPHITGAREMFVEIEHPIAGKIKITGNHLKFSDTKAEIKSPAPTLGQHTEEILKKYLGYSHVKIEQLKEDKAI